MVMSGAKTFLYPMQIFHIGLLFDFENNMVPGSEICHVLWKVSLRRHRVALAVLKRTPPSVVLTVRAFSQDRNTHLSR